MRARTIVAILAVAVGLGLLTGRYVLPARQASAAKPSAAPSSPAGRSPAPEPAAGPMTDQRLLTAADFGGIGFSQRVYVRDRVGDGSYANAACTGEKTLAQTLGGREAYFRGLLTSSDTSSPDPTMAKRIEDQIAREVAADAGSPSLAGNFAERLLLEETACQSEPAGHWVYGPTHTVDVAPRITASWLGTYEGDLNTTGYAPRGQEPCGGIAILRNGSHYGVLDIHACLGSAAMTQIVRTAVTRL